MQLEDLLSQLARGSESWNSWRQSSKPGRLELRGAKLRKARLSRADLSEVDLTGADLDGVLLYGANLRAACLRGARFYAATLCGADLRKADLRTAFLRGADLQHVDLRLADLRDTDLRGANLRYSDLRNASLHGADLRDADLRDADLRGVALTHAKLTGASLAGAQLGDDEASVEQVRLLDEAARSTIASEHEEVVGDAVLARLRHALVDTGAMLERELSEATQQCVLYTKFREDNPSRHWPLLTMVAFIEATKPHLMFRAWAAIHDKPFGGISALCESLHDLFGPEFFVGRKLDKPIPRGLSFGHILHEMGVVNATDLQEARTLRAEIEHAIGVRLFLGTLLVRRSLITLGEYYQVLAIHYGVEFTGLDDATVRRISEEWGEFSELQTVSIPTNF